MHSHSCLKVVYGAVKSANATMLGVFDGFYLETCVFMFTRVFFLFEIRKLLFGIYSTVLEMQMQLPKTLSLHPRKRHDMNYLGFFLLSSSNYNVIKI